MSSTMTTTLGTSNLRSSSRQTRTNPTRTSKTLGTSLRQNSLVDNPALPPITNNEPQNIYPAIQHFTDAINALPREYRRHTSLLKEVDAKAWAPEERLQQLLGAALASKPPRFPTTALPSAAASITGPLENTAQNSAANSVTGAMNDLLSQASSLPTDPANFPRRKLFYDLRYNLNEMMVTMDEKNHVMNNANEELGRNLQRLNTIFPHLDAEISEGVRLGSSTHWAYAENRASAKALVGGESRSRKEAAAGLAIMSNEHAAARSETRREAVRENKKLKGVQQQPQDSDIDERPAGRRTNPNGKAKRVGELAAEAGHGLGISSPSAPARKKRPSEKTAVGGVAMERNTSGSHMGGTSMSRQASQQETTKKRRAPKDATTAPARKRPQNASSAANSPLLASTPMVGSFGKEGEKASPAPRPQPSRGRQNSTQDVTRGRPVSSASNKPAANGNGVARTPVLQQVGDIAGKSAAEVKATMKESTSKNGDRLFEEDTKATNGEAEGAVRGGILLERSSSKASHTEKLKRDAEEAPEGGRGRKNSSAAPSPRLPPSGLAIESSTARPDRRRAASSKTSTPIVQTFEEAGITKPNGAGRPPNRPSRQNTLTSNTSSSDATSAPTQPIKRSHKKGAGLAAQAAAMAAARAAAERPGEVEEDIIDGEEEENEPLYCYCQQVSYGEMVACDAEDCKREWFHLECAGLDRAPGRNAKWYCDDCKERLKKGKALQGIDNVSSR